jgi:hypothetical protein
MQYLSLKTDIINCYLFILCEIDIVFNFRSDNFDAQIYMHYHTVCVENALVVISPNL